LIFLVSGFKVLAPKDATTEEKFNYLKNELHGLLLRLLPDLKFEVCVSFGGAVLSEFNRYMSHPVLVSYFGFGIDCMSKLSFLKKKQKKQNQKDCFLF
jgi:hypothetical protein